MRKIKNAQTYNFPVNYFRGKNSVIGDRLLQLPSVSNTVRNAYSSHVPDSFPLSFLWLFYCMQRSTLKPGLPPPSTSKKDTKQAKGINSAAVRAVLAEQERREREEGESQFFA